MLNPTRSDNYNLYHIYIAKEKLIAGLNESRIAQCL